MALLVRCPGCGAEFRANPKHRGKDAHCVQCGAALVVDGPPIPDHDVFISYSSADKHAADAICAALEARRWRCWIAPRNVTAGSEWGATIIEAIEQSRLVVLVYSSRANQSQQVLREIERAVSKGLPLIPFRIEAAPPSKNMEYFLSTSHWMDALTGPLEQHIGELAHSVGRLLSHRGEIPVGGRAAAVRGDGRAAGEAGWWRGRRLAVAALVVAALIGAGAAATFFRGRPPARAEGTTRPSSQPAATQPETRPSADAQPAGITTRTVLVADQRFSLRPGSREAVYPVAVPPIASGAGWLQIRVTDMGDDSGDGGMYCVILDARGAVVSRRFGRVAKLFTHRVTSRSSWTVALIDRDTHGKGNAGRVEIAVAPD